MNTVIICDTEPIAMEGFRSLLALDDRLRVVAAESSLVDGLDAARELNPALLLMDKAFGFQTVVDSLRNLKRTAPATSSVVWSNSMSEAEALRLLQAGAAGVVRKTAPLERVMECVHTVLAGRTWMDSDMVRENEFARPTRSPLTARELQIMELVERGYKNKDIGLALGIRTGTVKIHLKHIFEKTGIRGRYGLALNGLKEKGLLAAAPCA